MHTTESTARVSSVVRMMAWRSGMAIFALMVGAPNLAAPARAACASVGDSRSAPHPQTNDPQPVEAPRMGDPSETPCSNHGQQSTTLASALRNADALVASGRRREAIACYRTLLASPHPDLSAHMAGRLYLQLADVYLEAGDFAAARATLLTLRRSDCALSAEIRWRRKEIDRIEGEAARAVRSGVAGIRADPASPWGFRELLEGLHLQGRLPAALDLLAVALGRPLHGAEALALIDASDDIRQSRGAMDLAKLWLQQHPRDHPMRNTLLGLATTHAPLDELIELHSRALPLLPDARLARFRYARRLAEEQQAAVALGQYALLLDDAEFGLDSHLASAELHARLGDANAVIATLRQAVERWPLAVATLPGRQAPKPGPFAALIRHARNFGRLATLFDDWPALAGPNGPIIRLHLEQAAADMATDSSAEHPADD